MPRILPIVELKSASRLGFVYGFSAGSTPVATPPGLFERCGGRLFTIRSASSSEFFYRTGYSVLSKSASVNSRGPSTMSVPSSIASYKKFRLLS